MWQELKMKDTFIYRPKIFSDKRGKLTKIYSKQIFLENGITSEFGETMLSRNHHKGVVRGFHFQYPPYAQAKLMHCMSGKMKFMLLDIRKTKGTYGVLEEVVLSEDDGQVLFIPEGVINAFVTLEDNTILVYHMTKQHMVDYEGGVLWNSVGTDFGIKNPILSDKDLILPKFEDFESPF